MDVKATVNKWKDPEYMREYRRVYYLKRKGEQEVKEKKWTPEHAKEYQKNYYKAHADMLTEKRRATQQVCEVCYGHFTKVSKAKHEQTQRHTRALEHKNI
jgi:hypothetical protein